MIEKVTIEPARKATPRGLRRRTWLAAMAACGALASPRLHAQGASPQLPLVVFISNFAPGDTRWNIDAFIAGLQDQGYADGRNLRLALRYTEGRPERLPAMAAEIAKLKPAVIVASGTPAGRALRDATPAIPAVLAVISDPVRRGLAASFAHPGGNITGLGFQNSELTTKRLQLLREVAPASRRVGLVADAAENDSAGVKEAIAAAATLGLEGTAYVVTGAADFERALDSMVRDRIDGIVVLASPMLNANRKPLIQGIRARRLPATYEVRAFVEDGGLMSYGPSFVAMYRRSAVYVDRILRGEKPGDLPMEQPSTFELVINRSAARDLHLAFPESLLLRADAVLS